VIISQERSFFLPNPRELNSKFCRRVRRATSTGFHQGLDQIGDCVDCDTLQLRRCRPRWVDQRFGSPNSLWTIPYNLLTIWWSDVGFSALLLTVFRISVVCEVRTTVQRMEAMLSSGSWKGHIHFVLLISSDCTRNRGTASPPLSSTSYGRPDQNAAPLQLG
jgi:hypothetical protein